jgi:hypothetical protein
MNTKHTDPWATAEPGFKPYTGRSADDGFSPMDSRARDLATYLRAELAAHPERQAPIETVTLANGARAQLSQRSTDDWELVIHLRRDFYQVFNAKSRKEVLEAADADCRARPS